MTAILKNMYDNLFLPVVICQNREGFPVIYMNPRASLLLSPTQSVDQLRHKASLEPPLGTLLRFKNKEEYETFLQQAMDAGRIDEYIARIDTPGGEELSVSISGAAITCKTENDCFALYILSSQHDAQNLYDRQLTTIINSIFITNDVERSIQSLLKFAGESAGVSRVYVFEEISPLMTRNTYEWCAKGVAPAIGDLQNLAKSDYNYDVIVGSGMYIAEDVSTLPESDRQILESQGIHALAIMTIYDNDKPLGYVGFDDCNTVRSWSHDEIQYLKSISVLLAMFIVRRNFEIRLGSTLDVMKLISDNSQAVIYANDVETYEILFVNQPLADALNTTPEDMIGKKCYHVLHIGHDGPCDFCPMPKIKREPGQESSEVYTWELVNDITGKTYLAKDNIVSWLDGRLAHIETATDISERIEYEKRLQMYASIDQMTGILNREWGATQLAEKLKHRVGGSLCFLDIDGLKMTNDTYGHAVGDQMLKETVRLLRENMPGQGFICRWGGDEFLLWMDAAPEHARQKLQAILAVMREYNKTGVQVFKLSFSYGIVEFSSSEHSNVALDALITAADELMYSNKMSKRGAIKRRRRDDRLF